MCVRVCGAECVVVCTGPVTVQMGEFIRKQVMPRAIGALLEQWQLQVVALFAAHIGTAALATHNAFVTLFVVITSAMSVLFVGWLCVWVMLWQCYHNVFTVMVCVGVAAGMVFSVQLVFELAIILAKATSPLLSSL